MLHVHGRACASLLPDLREHAIFALRNLLDGNLENQAVVNAIQPVGRYDENKVLQEFRGGEVAGE